jgi:type IV pilus assembly protein PilN
MIRINLLPAELESAPTQINPAIPLGAAVLVPLLVLTPVHFAQVSKRNDLEKKVKRLTDELASYQPIIARVEALEKTKKQLNDRKSVIQSLETERLRYPQFMDDFLKLLPSNLWLTNLTTAIQPAGNIMTVNMDVTALDNYAIADLVANLETSQIFTDVDLGTITATQTPNGQTMGFHLTTVYRKAAPVPDASKKS